MGNHIHFANEAPERPVREFGRDGELYACPAGTPSGNEFVLNHRGHKHVSPTAFKTIRLMQPLLMQLCVMEEARQARTNRISRPSGSADRRSSIDAWGQTLRVGFHLACLLVMTMFFATTANALPTNPPPGPYQQSCRGASVNGTTLTATCIDFFGKYRLAHLNNYAACTGSFTDANGNKHPRNIFDIDGDLRCVVDLKKRPNNDKHDPGSLFDVISVSDVTIGGVAGKVWRIDRPNVWQRTTAYPLIRFKPGDRIWFKAGGCAQTGRHGKSWDEYLWPQGDDAPTRYAGTAYIQMVTGSAARRIGSLMSCQPHHVSIPNPGEQIGALTLGYEDNDYSDNGYWGHDDGQNDQCKNVGPAWVEVTVLPGTPSKRTTQWSPACKPLDLVWNTVDEDFNGLPLNPMWNFQLQHKGEQPDFTKFCSAAFPDNTTVDYTRLGEQCTSQDPSIDIHWALGAICNGWPLQGHLNWMIATYQGPVWFESISGTHLGDNALWDDDYNFDLKPQREAGLTCSGDKGKPCQPAATIHMEMDPTESINHLGSTWWQRAQGYILPGGALSSKAIHSTDDLHAMFGGAHGLYGVVTGLFGLDAEHGGQSELHPIYGMAVRTSDTVQGNKIRQHWAYFLRNYGNEGGCASAGLHMWDSTVGDYFVHIPKVEGTTMDPRLSQVQGWAWDKSNISHVSFMHSKDWLVVKIRPHDATTPFGVDGEFTVEFTLPAAMKEKKVAAAEGPPKAREAERESADLGANITDPEAKAKFTTAMRTLPPAPPKERVRLEVSSEVTPTQRSAGAAGKGQSTGARVVADPTLQQREAQLIQVLQTHQRDLKIEVPANLTSKAAVVRSKPSEPAPANKPPAPE